MSVESIAFVRDLGRKRKLQDADFDDQGLLVVVARFQAEVKRDSSLIFDVAIESEVTATFNEDSLVRNIINADTSNVFIAADIHSDSLSVASLTESEVLSEFGGDDLFQFGGCLLNSRSATIIANCECHITCRTCGFGNDAHEEPDYCLSCSNGFGLLQLYTDGTGECKENLLVSGGGVRVSFVSGGLVGCVAAVLTLVFV